MQNRIVVTVLSLLLVLCTGVTGCSAKSAEETKKSSTEETEKNSKKTEKEKTEGFDETRLGFYTNGSWGMDIKSIDNKSKTITYDGYEDGAREASCTDQTGRLLMTIRWISMESLLNGKEILLKLKMRRMC